VRPGKRAAPATAGEQKRPRAREREQRATRKTTTTTPPKQTNKQTNKQRNKTKKRTDLHLLEVPLRQQVPLDALQRLVRVVVRRLHEAQFLAGGLVKAHGGHVLLLEPLERQDQQLGLLCVLLCRFLSFFFFFFFFFFFCCFCLGLAFLLWWVVGGAGGRPPPFAPRLRSSLPLA